MLLQSDFDALAESIKQQVYYRYMFDGRFRRGNPLTVSLIVTTHELEPPSYDNTLYDLTLNVWNQIDERRHFYDSPPPIDCVASYHSVNGFTIPAAYRVFNTTRDERIAYIVLSEFFLEQTFQHVENFIEQGRSEWGDRPYRMDTLNWEPRLAQGIPEERITQLPRFQITNDTLLHTEEQWIEATNRWETQDQFGAEIHEKADNLLRSVLTQTQLQEWLEYKTITVVGNVTDRIYTLTKQQSINITCKDQQGNKICKYCIVPKESVPIEDQLLGQVLMITANENDFLATAIKW